MQAIELSLEERSQSGGEAGLRLRNAGLVPAVVYGRGEAARMATLKESEFKRFMLGASSSQLFKFKSPSKSFDGQLALVKEIQMEPIKGRALHVDFLEVREDQKIRVPVSIEMKGESPSIKGGEGVLNQSAFEIEVFCMPSQIPNVVYADISALTVGHSIHAGELELPEGVVLKSDPKLTIVSIVHKKEEVFATPAAAATADTAAAGTEGAAPAAGAADAKAAGGDKAAKK